MDCKEIQDFILSDYSDRELDNEQYHMIADHIHYCPACKQFEEKVKIQTKQPFTFMHMTTPPASLWESISNAINDLENRNIFALLREKFSDTFGMHKKIFALTSAGAVCIILLLVITMSYMRNDELSGNSNGTAEFISEIDFTSNSNAEENSTFGTVIEEYFL